MLASIEMELDYSAYQERQYAATAPQAVRSAADAVRPAGRFRHHAGLWSPEPYVGHAVVTMCSTSPMNGPLLRQLQEIQSWLCYHRAAPDMYLLPESSFHQTIANTLSAERHHSLVVARGLEAVFPPRVAGAFADLSPVLAPTPLEMRMIGVSIFGAAVGVLGVFEREEDFQRVLVFRDQFYGHEQVGRLGIRRTRPFIGHITLAYVEAQLDQLQRSHLAEAVIAINAQLADREMRFHLPVAELRAYQHLAEFRALPGLPVYRF